MGGCQDTAGYCSVGCTDRKPDRAVRQHLVVKCERFTRENCAVKFGAGDLPTADFSMAAALEGVKCLIQ
jgi:hypothetical protein